MNTNTHEEILKKLREIIPNSGIVYNEKHEFPEVLCKPKLLPLKSMTIKKLEELEKNFEKINQEMLKKNK
jgi:BBSome-interacting protein 1